MLPPAPAAQVALFSPFPGKLLPGCPGSNTGGLLPCLSGFPPESPDFQLDSPAPCFLIAPDLSIS
ncbi:hypothetical protein KEP82_19195 [Escherichia coli]|nr:hypothetical protein [Escherichia coli]MBS9199483.1 hypothetical protein [Escherichia coli]